MAHLRVEGVRVAAEDLRRWDEALVSVADLARCGADGEEGWVPVAAFEQPEDLCREAKGEPCPAYADDYCYSYEEDERA